MPDWAKLKEEYVSGTMSLRDMAEIHEIPWSTVRKHAMNEKWAQAREQRRHKVEQAVEQKAVKKAAKEIWDEQATKERIRQKLLKISEKWIDRYTQLMEEAPENAPETQDFRRMAQTCIDLGVAEGIQTGDEDKITVEFVGNKELGG